MQIFLPFADFIKSLNALDNQRLGKQRIEAYQIWLAINGLYKKSWGRHPLIRMWKDHEVALRYYICKCVEIFGSRKTKDGKRFFANTKMLENIEKYDLTVKPDEKIIYPSFIGMDEFHDSHKAMLYHKGQEAVKIAALKGKELENPYECFKDYAHITRYYWPVRLVTGITLTAERPTIPLSNKRKQEVLELRELEEKAKKTQKVVKKTKKETIEKDEGKKGGSSKGEIKVKKDKKVIKSKYFKN
eukprot:TRINITY_DN13238_c0_g1_i1.p1 TRINITY_DN13238_c0_g1~~TRINITY_DN13238_c0_g1_i1.p1  ORF type:complete len:244 (-),score=41.43 TRINITY_DN13238_c0_g1_i1:77-808(-)